MIDANIRMDITPVDIGAVPGTVERETEREWAVRGK